MKKAVLIAVGLGFLCTPVFAASPDHYRGPEASLLVTGTITVGPDGSVRSYALDHPEKLPSAVVDLVGKTAAGWRFEPVLLAGKPVAAKACMSLRVVARKTDHGGYAVYVRGERFAAVDGLSTASRKRTYPRYPAEALHALAGATVYLAIDIDSQGHVSQIAVRQVNLSIDDAPGVMSRLRRDFADASIKAARQWTFAPMGPDALARANHWTAVIPMSFTLDINGSSPKPPSYGNWEVYFPGPLQTVSWLDKSDSSAENADALPAGQLVASESELHLLRPVSSSLPRG